MSNQPILTVNNLKTHFFTDHGVVPAVDGVSFKLNKGEILGIVGESGCGKSVTSLSIMKLLPNSIGRIVDGEILLNGEDIRFANEKRMRQIRGKEIGMIFQEPMTSLDPLFTIGDQLMEAIRIHNRSWGKKEVEKHAITMLKKVDLPRAEDLMKNYPHQLSGGMRQRVMIAMAMACSPELLIADEPTTALDVTIQSQIMRLMKELNRVSNTAIMLITHDLGVVASICQRVIVMYSGRVVEEGSVEEIFKHPKHPYTVGLLRSVPDIRNAQEHLYSIKGNVPRPGSVKQGCRFANRCPAAYDKCFRETPDLVETGATQKSRCFLYQDNKEKELS